MPVYDLLHASSVATLTLTFCAVPAIKELEAAVAQQAQKLTAAVQQVEAVVQQVRHTEWPWLTFCFHSSVIAQLVQKDPTQPQICEAVQGSVCELHTCNDRH